MILWFRYLRREGGSLRKANDTKPVFCGPEARLRWERRHCAPIFSSACPTQQNNTGFVAFGGLLDFRRPGCLVSSSIGKADFTFFRFVKSSQIFFCACVISVTFVFSAPRFLSLRWGKLGRKKITTKLKAWWLLAKSWTPYGRPPGERFGPGLVNVPQLPSVVKGEFLPPWREGA